MTSFADYLWKLLPSPYKLMGKRGNRWLVLCRVLGRQLDSLKAQILDLRELSMVLTCPGELLGIFGTEREMPRLRGEAVEAHRRRLLMKYILAQKAGTRAGILLALSSIGYDRSRIQPLYETDPDRWAEFFVWLGSSTPSGITDLEVVDEQVMRVKSASSKPAYGVEAGNDLAVESRFTASLTPQPLCGITICGEWPEPTHVAHLLQSEMAMAQLGTAGEIDPPRCGHTRVANGCYVKEETR